MPTKLKCEEEGEEYSTVVKWQVMIVLTMNSDVQTEHKVIVISSNQTCTIVYGNIYNAVSSLEYKTENEEVCGDKTVTFEIKMECRLRVKFKQMCVRISFHINVGKV